MAPRSKYKDGRRIIRIRGTIPILVHNAEASAIDRWDTYPSMDIKSDETVEMKCSLNGKEIGTRPSQIPPVLR